jgi:4-amino-4-deoxy-L-arabinose transferase-like glycosyltransferase
MWRRSWLLVPLLCAPMLFVGLGRPGLNDPDEGRNAEVGREMLVSGDFITPRLNDAVYLDKPPVFFWAGAVAMAVTGINETGARLPSAIAALLGIALTTWFARRRFGKGAAVIAGLILALSPLYVVFGRLVIFDMLLLVFTTTSIMAAYEAMEGERTGRRLPAAIFFVSAAIGTLTKGPVALAVPALVAVVWACARRQPSLLGRLRWGTGLLIYLAIVAPWPLLIEARHPGYLSYALLGENLRRMTANPYETARPFLFYVKVILPGLFPWLLLVLAQGIAALARRLRRLAAPPAEDALAARFVGVWLAVEYLFFSIITSKRPSYILPCAVPVALLAARLIVRAAGGGELAGGLVTAALATVALAAAAWIAGPALASTDLAEDRHPRILEAAGLFRATAIALVVCAIILFLVRRSRRPALIVTAAALPFFCVLPAARAAARQVETARSSRAASRFLAERLRPGDRVVCFEEYKPGLNFYLQRPIHQFTRQGRIFTSNYIAAQVETLRGDPGFRLMSPEVFAAALRDRSSTTWVLSPHKEYASLREAAGGAPLDAVWEAGGFGLFTPSAAAAVN